MNNKFDVLDDKYLQGKHLLEASAGTGKTFSISILALRMLLEKGIEADKLLLVTFTKAATAELSDRISFFIYKAYKYSIDESSVKEEPSLSKILHEIKIKAGADFKKRAEHAYRNRSKINIQTIHSFSASVLKANPLQTNQNFVVNTLNDKDYDDVIKNVLLESWRSKIVTIDNETVEILKEKKLDHILKFNTLLRIVKAYLDGIKIDPNYTAKSDLIFPLERETISLSVNKLLLDICEETKRKIDEHKKQNQLQTFADMIELLFDIVVTNKQNIDLPYQAVFIDEFQDTDYKQIKIFEKLFHNLELNLYYVGDPKQSIYSFRGADIDSYLEVKDDFREKTSTMNTNYRSSKEFVDACNLFFKKGDDFFKCENKIEYEKVDAENNATLSDLKPISFSTTKNDLEYEIPNIVSNLYGQKYTKDGNEHTVNFGNIAVLVRANSTGLKIKQQLEKHKIPSVLLANTDVFTTEEVEDLLKLLKAIQQPSDSTINELLLTALFPVTVEDVRRISNSAEINEIFFAIKNNYQEQGFFSSMEQILTKCNIREALSNNTSKIFNLRKLSNLQQLIEYCNQQVLSHNLSLDAVIDLLEQKKHNDGDSEEEGVSELRIETDEDAVQILTIHKSKGLEFDFVICPDLRDKRDLRKDARSSHYSYKKGKEKYLSVDYYNLETRGLYNEEQEKESRRLVYVALTRAKYHCHILNKKSSSNKTLFSMLEKTSSNQNLCKEVVIPEFKEFSINESFDSSKDAPKSNRDSYSQNPIMNSYSGLHKPKSLETYRNSQEQIEDSYDKFIFHEMKKGNVIGNCIHELFENADFTQESFTELIAEKQKKYGKGIIPDTQKPNFQLLMENVLCAKLPNCDFTLSQVKRSEMLPELEFYFKTGIGLKDKLEKMGETEVDNYNGIIKGFIDLTFIHNGKYYILDWKSNFLGDTIENYTHDEMDKAMTNNDYHLQYKIYKLALKEYLESIQPEIKFDEVFGGVFYVFVRGCRKGKETGVFYSE